MNSRGGNDFDVAMLSSEDVTHHGTDWLFAFASEEYEDSARTSWIQVVHGECV